MAEVLITLPIFLGSDQLLFNEVRVTYQISISFFTSMDELSFRLVAKYNVNPFGDRKGSKSLYIPEKEALRDPFARWELNRCKTAGLDTTILHAYSLAMPLGMGADGIWRYWDKVRTSPT